MDNIIIKESNKKIARSLLYYVFFWSITARIIIKEFQGSIEFIVYIFGFALLLFTFKMVDLIRRIIINVKKHKKCEILKVTEEGIEFKSRINSTEKILWENIWSVERYEKSRHEIVINLRNLEKYLENKNILKKIQVKIRIFFMSPPVRISLKLASENAQQVIDLIEER